MKKSLGVALSLSVVWSAVPAQAEFLKNLRIGGQIDIQATSAMNVSDFSSRQNISPAPTGAAIDTNNDRVGDVQTRVLLHLDWDLLDDVHSRISLRKNDRTWGTATGTPNNESGAGIATNSPSQTLGAPGTNNILGTVAVDEANVKIDKVAGAVDITLGRQFYGTPGDVVIFYGPSDKAWYGLPVTPVDAARLDWNDENIGITGVAGKIKGHAVGTAGQSVNGAAGDIDLRGLNFALKGTENYSGALYIYNAMTHNTAASGQPATTAGTGGKADNLYVAGLKLKLASNGFWWRGEYDQDFGENRVTGTTQLAPAANYRGYAFLTNLGYKVENENAGMFSAWGEFALGSGRQNSRENKNDGFVSINSDYRPGSIYGRFAANNVTTLSLGGGTPGAVNAGAGSAAGIVKTVGANAQAGLANRVIWGLGVKASPAFANKLVAGVSFWDFRLHRFTNSPNQSTFDGNAPLQGNKHIGSEIDVDFVWTHSENVAFATGFGTFQPGGLIKEANRLATQVAGAPNGGIGTSPATLAYFDTRVRF